MAIGDQSLGELLDDAAAGAVDRRGFIGRAIALGMTYSVAGAFAATVFPDEAEAATPRIKIVPKWGPTPKVLTKGWKFRVARLVGFKGNPEKVRWSGSGKFSPEVGRETMVTFHKPGKNVIRVQLGAVVSKHLLAAKDASLYALDGAKGGADELGDYGMVLTDAHGCPSCPHNCTGPAVATHPECRINGRGVVRVGDKGQHLPGHRCCRGSNDFVVVEGDPEVLLGGKPVAKIGSKTKHCGGYGKIIRGKVSSKKNRPCQ